MSVPPRKPVPFWMEADPNPPKSPVAMPSFDDEGGVTVDRPGSPAHTAALREAAMIEAGLIDPNANQITEAMLSPYDKDREALAFILMLREGPPIPGGFYEPPNAEDLLRRYRAGTLTPYIRTSSIGSPDETPEGADWTKQVWDMPPYKSDEFFGAVGTDLDSFRRLPVYRYAVANGLIVNDEWVGDAGLSPQTPPEQQRPIPRGGKRP